MVAERASAAATFMVDEDGDDMTTKRGRYE
jgi:hypothetical protein